MSKFKFPPVVFRIAGKIVSEQEVIDHLNRKFNPSKDEKPGSGHDGINKIGHLKKIGA